MYLSPFRAETAPSFKVNYNQNIWYDFGSGEGGSIIDLVMRLEHCSVSEKVALNEQNHLRQQEAEKLNHEAEKLKRK